jgi:histidyl-tRNA synthetase
MRDLLPDKAERLRYIEQAARETAYLHGYREIITPIVEHYELLAAKVGEENRKRMFIFEDLGGRKVALRPEFTASVARLMATKLVADPKPLRLFSVGSLYRYDEPQFGRYREFWQANYELFGSNKPESDAEILILTDNLLNEIGLENYQLKIGHVGIIKGILTEEHFSEDKQNSIMQLLDKKEWETALNYLQQEGCTQKCLDTLQKIFNIKSKDPISTINEITEVTSDYTIALRAIENLAEILNLLEFENFHAKLLLDAGFARGLEYYTGIIFEMYVPEMEIALGGGGRYDKLIMLFSGDMIPAVGVAPGIDRLVLALEDQGKIPQVVRKHRILIIPVNREMIKPSFQVASLLRDAGLVVEVEAMGRSVSKALSDANRRGITHTLILGPREMADNTIVMRQMAERVQETVKVKNLIKLLKQPKQ